MKAFIFANHYEDYINYRINFKLFVESVGYDVIAIIPKPDNRDEEHIDGNLYLYNYRRNWKFVFYIFDCLKLLINLNKKYSPDVMFTLKFFPNIIGNLSSYVFATKRINMVAGLGFLEKRDKNIIVKMIFLIYIFLLKRGDYLIVQNKEDKKVFEEFLPGHSIVLTHGSGVDLDLIKQKKNNLLSIREIKLDLGLDLDKKHFLFCTRILKEKGIFELIDAFNNNLEIQKKFNLIIAGWFDQKKLEQLVLERVNGNKNICYLGYQKDVYPLLKIADCSILPSYSEGVPRSLTESLAFSVPIITTDVKGCRETVVNGINGFLVNVRDMRDLSLKMSKFAELEEYKLEEMKEASLRLFYEKFTDETVFSTIAKECNL